MILLYIAILRLKKKWFPLHPNFIIINISRNDLSINMMMGVFEMYIISEYDVRIWIYDDFSCELSLVNLD